MISKPLSHCNSTTDKLSDKRLIVEIVNLPIMVFLWSLDMFNSCSQKGQIPPESNICFPKASSS